MPDEEELDDNIAEIPILDEMEDDDGLDEILPFLIVEMPDLD
jgi:hypothetical protein